MHLYAHLQLEKVFVVVQQSFELKLVLGADKTKLMMLSSSRNWPQMILSVTTNENKKIEVVHMFRYLGIVIGYPLSHKQLATATLLPVLEYGDILLLLNVFECLVEKIHKIFKSMLCMLLRKYFH